MPAIAVQIDVERAFDMIVNGKSLREIAVEMDVSAYKVYKDLTATPELEKQYARAKELQAEMLADEIIQISDDGSNDTYKKTDADGNEYGEEVNHDVIARSRLRVDARKWVAAKLLPKKYGDKQGLELTGPAGGPLLIQKIERFIVDPQRTNG